MQGVKIRYRCKDLWIKTTEHKKNVTFHVQEDTQG